MTRDEMTRIIMQEVQDALAEDDYKTAERIMARVSETRLEKIVEEAIEKAVGIFSRGDRRGDAGRVGVPFRIRDDVGGGRMARIIKLGEKKIKNALKAMREAVPQYFEDRISDRDCPSDWGLRENCPHVDKNAKARTCRECWRLALEDE